MGRNSQVNTLINQRFRVLIGNGLNTDFWNDNWAGRESLKMIFPRIFVLTQVRKGSAANFGHWDHGSCTWEVTIRRRTFDWEDEVWEQFTQVLRSVYLDENSSNRIIWTPKPLGVFSCKSFKSRLIGDIPAVLIQKLLWPWMYHP